MRNEKMVRSARVRLASGLVAAGMMGLFAAGAMAAVGNGNAPILGTLGTKFGASIPAPDLATWLTQYTPAASQQMVILSECFGGNALQAFPAGTFANTTVLSATSPGQAAVYGAWDIGVADALKPYTPPAAATSAADVFAAGVAKKNAVETPITGGGLAPGNFSLESTSTDDFAINGRQIVFYAGQPDLGNGTDGDAVQFGKVQTSFNGQMNTGVKAVGDDPDSPPVVTAAEPWTLPGTAAGLQQGIQTTTPTGLINQRVTFVADHGGVRNVAGGFNRSAGANNASPKNTQALLQATGLPPLDPTNPQAGDAVPVPLVNGFQTFTKLQVPVALMNGNNPMSGGGGGGGAGTPDSTPSFSILVPLNNIDAQGAVTPDATNAANGLKVGPGATNLVNNPAGGPGWVLYLKNTNAAAAVPLVQLFSTFQTVYDPIGGNAAGSDFNVDSGIRVGFQIKDPLGRLPQPGTPAFDDIFFGQTFNVTLLNYTGMNWDVAEFSQDNPGVANLVPEPSAVALSAVTAIVGLGRRRRRT